MCTFVDWIDEPWPPWCQRIVRDLVNMATTARQNGRELAAKYEEAVRHFDEAVQLCGEAVANTVAMETATRRVIKDKTKEVRSAREAARAWQAAMLVLALSLLMLLFLQGNK